jgi:dynein heavy chain
VLNWAPNYTNNNCQLPQPQVVPAFVSKIVQIFDCKAARHGNMIVGRTGAGKSEAWRALAGAMGRLRREGVADARFQKVGAQ